MLALLAVAAALVVIGLWLAARPPGRLGALGVRLYLIGALLGFWVVLFTWLE